MRERRRAETASGLAHVTRRMTAERGLSGFTVDEVCREVGVSRRTFFNYFASKEDAIFGIAVRSDDDYRDVVFLGARQEHQADSASLVADYVGLVLSRSIFEDWTPESTRQLIAAVRREPRLMTHMLDRARARSLDDIALIERTEGYPAGDPRASTLVHVVGALVSVAGEDILTGATAEPFDVLVRERVAVVGDLFTVRKGVVT
ncbi:TetR/AcrR family transcriptional regulator [Allobranchiibius sp. CTAmp26]|uniref:TetR/AcrR family transcriptional regulator n=1 Tax=Allobranchiibius sp. CTAmp26 TaxID=2815214 RepID=UPI001AA19757|nr:TetR/AcrR family transcriptional regulator [Allobranchiibius sp. CTAmp26]MBO1756949.1 TetR family transcriptional regulator [Allobranchiibius sp. CTAmp26]